MESRIHVNIIKVTVAGEHPSIPVRAPQEKICFLGSNKKEKL